MGGPRFDTTRRAIPTRRSIYWSTQLRGVIMTFQQKIRMSIAFEPATALVGLAEEE